MERHQVGDYQNYAVTYSTYGDEKITTDLNIIPNNGVLKILKLDSETEVPIEGVSFELLSEDGNYRYEGVTDSNGELCFENLYQGNYILTEIDSGANYVLDEQKMDISIVYNETKEITVWNEAKKGKIKIIKIDSEDRTPISGVKFKIVDNKTGKILETITTDENGIALSSYLRIDGDYYFQEIESAEGYILNKEKHYFNVTNTETIEFTITNEKEPEPEPEIEEEIKILPRTGR